ncbi:hypothetical protein HMPREF9621_02593 [Cutibacterium modestum HL037PA2]|uniref:Uncharacterized protein n=1 Tax=Cutibacterium modestum HL044PA1 TaxID=765109 RepID=A0ABN0C4I6_9ACTN|nr:hypothetical protein HMPREF9621_02593 [Cutibacterium modestum HL037PA2]EFS92053.1 hypothetical protein HMPREF9607_01681 [Cutibacterium modestum HL044PA1]
MRNESRLLQVHHHYSCPQGVRRRRPGRLPELREAGFVVGLQVGVC